MRANLQKEGYVGKEWLFPTMSKALNDVFIFATSDFTDCVCLTFSAFSTPSFHFDTSTGPEAPCPSFLHVDSTNTNFLHIKRMSCDIPGLNISHRHLPSPVKPRQKHAARVSETLCVLLTFLACLPFISQAFVPLTDKTFVRPFSQYIYGRSGRSTFSLTGPKTRKL